MATGRSWRGCVINNPMSFIRRTEDFVCGHCGAEVVGDGYTNHCPRCLWSRHVDVDPGDRAAECLGLMRPIAVELVKDRFVITTRCETCGHTRRNRAGDGDNRDTLIAIVEERNRPVTKG